MTKQELLERIEQATKGGWTELNLRGEYLTELPPEIAQLSQLRELNLSGNQLMTLPPEIAQLSQLQKLNLRGNQLMILPPAIAQLSQLHRLDLSRNQLMTLPPAIAQLSQLQWLDLRGNPLPIPSDILSKSDKPTEIITYYFKVTQGERSPLNEAKMLLVGQGGVGKTSLVNRLLDNTYNPQENKTEGIVIRNWFVTPAKQPPIRVNVWDFGGQEIMHATHQFFLTKRSLYLLVLDARQGENESRLEYWLKIVHSFGEDSPILVIINKIDQQPLDLDRQGLLAKYSNLKTFFDISCQTGKGIDDLKVALTQWIDKLEHVHDPFPQAWFSVKDRLATMQQDYLSYDDYVKLCQEENIHEENSQRTLIGFMHDLGIALNFRDDPQRPHLAETNILNPEWVTQGVYSLLNNHTLAQQHGVLNTTQLPELLDSHRYPTHKQPLIVGIMEKFELCFAFEGREQFLIPDLLGKEQVNQVKTWDYANSLAFQYHYDVLPPSVISRFIVRMKQRIWERTYWRTGVILAMDNNQALVRADLEDKKVLIWVTGTDAGKRALLAVIRAEFERIHQSISKLQVIEQVPYKGIVIPYQDLLNAEQDNIKIYYQPTLREKIDVQKMLNGIEEKQQRQYHNPQNQRTEIHIHGDINMSGNQYKAGNITNSPGTNVGADNTSIANRIQQMPDSTNKEILRQIQEQLERSKLSPQDKEDALYQIIVLAEMPPQPTPVQRSSVRAALGFLSNVGAGMVANLISKFVIP